MNRVRVLGNGPHTPTQFSLSTPGEIPEQPEPSAHNKNDRTGGQTSVCCVICRTMILIEPFIRPHKQISDCEQTSNA